MKNRIKEIGKKIFLMAKVLVKEIIVLFPTKGLNSAAIRLKAKNLADNLDAQELTFGVMSPTTTVVKGMVTAGDSIVAQKQAAQLLVKSLVLAERANAKLIKTTINDNWLNTIKIGAAGDTAKIVGVGAAVKGQGTAPDKTKFGKTWPEVIGVNQNIPLKIALDLIINDVTMKGKPYGAVSIGCYRQVGGVAPLRNNHPLAVAVNPFSKMKFKDSFTSDQADLKVYYIFFWIDGDGNPGPESPVFPYTITS